MDENQIPDMIFEENKVKETYFDKYEGIQSEISQVTRFDENTDLSTTYLGKQGQTRNCNKSRRKFSNFSTRVYSRKISR